MEKNKIGEMKKKLSAFIVVIVVLLLIIIGMGVYIMYDKNIIFVSNNSTNEKKTSNGSNLENIDDENTNNNDNKEDTKNSTSNVDSGALRNFDVSKCLNCNGSSYTLSFYENATGLSTRVSQDKKNVSIHINWNLFGTNVLGMAPNGTTGEPEYNVTNFSNEISDVYIGGFGQSASGTTILFLMSDGSVEYTPVRKAVTQYQVKSYGKLDGVSDVVKFLTADTTGAVTTLAMKADGSFYDLGLVLNSTGNF